MNCVTVAAAVCRYCPEKTITETGSELGVIEQGHRNGLEFVHGWLRVGEAMSPPLIKKVRGIYPTRHIDNH